MKIKDNWVDTRKIVRKLLVGFDRVWFRKNKIICEKKYEFQNLNLRFETLLKTPVNYWN